LIRVPDGRQKASSSSPTSFGECEEFTSIILCAPTLRSSSTLIKKSRLVVSLALPPNGLGGQSNLPTAQSRSIHEIKNKHGQGQEMDFAQRWWYLFLNKPANIEKDANQFAVASNIGQQH
jgi:hypothetical protein